MKLFKMKNWDLQVDETAWGISAFKKLLKRDKTKEKQIAMKEMMFVYLYCDIKSDFLILPEEERGHQIKEEIGLPKKWKIDKDIEEAIRVYKKYSQTTIQKLYQQSLKAAQDIGNYLEQADVLLAERDDRGKPVTDIGKITTSLEKVPKLMANLKAAFQEVIKEQQDMEGKMSGSKMHNTFEDGLKFE